jgi:hypothetical protein
MEKKVIIPERVKVNLKDATLEEKLQVKAILDAHYAQLTSTFVEEADYCCTTSYWKGHTPHGRMISAKGFIERYGGKDYAPPINGMVFAPAEMKGWDSHFKKIGEKYGAKKQSLSGKVFTYFGMVFLEFVSIEYEWESGRKVGHSGRDYEELEKNITALLKTLHP